MRPYSPRSRTILGLLSTLVLSWCWLAPVAVAQDQISANLSVTGFTQALGPDPGTPSCPGGVLALTMSIEYTGAIDYDNLFYRIVMIDAPRTVIGAGGVGSDLNIPNANLGADMVLTSGEVFTASIPICLPDLTIFTLLVDVFGSQLGAGPKRVFVTSTVHDADLNEEDPAGGLAGGDAICQARADDAMLGGTWTAWLSTTSVNAIDRITDAPYFLVDLTTQIATDKAALLAGPLMAGINQTESGVVPSTSAIGIWTGTLSTGTVAPNN